ncbi:MAG: efflux transporter outer membrane subunit, partial [Brachymonas denitrificans]
ARAQYGVARADQLPTVGAGASMTRSRTAADASPSGRETPGNIYSANLASTGFELDFFGRVRSMSTAALNQYLATQEARDAAQISLIAEVAKAYVAQRTADEAMRISKMALDSREKTYRLAKLRFNAGVISAIDLRQNETLIESAHADYAAQTRLREQAGNALALLIGQPVPANLPPAQPLGKQVAVNALPVGMSSDVLLRRPDIRQSEYQLQAANANIGAARAAFFPRISLTGSFGSVSRELDGLFTGPNMAWSFMPQISLPIFDFGRNQSNLDLAHARKNIAVAQYEKSIQGAFREVADQLAARRTLADQLAAQERGYQAERERLRLVQMRYDNGISSSLDLLDAQRQSYALEQALLLTRQAAMNNRIDLYKVLGGGLVDVTAVAPVSAR